MAACAPAFDHFGRHVHWGAGHGALLAAARAVVDGERPALAGDEFGGAKVDEFDDAVVIEEDVLEKLVYSSRCEGRGGTYSRA